jgi:4-hydroxy-2-oxoheptanedioate aldolase
MPAANPLLERWRANEPTLGGWMTTADPQIAEYLAGAGFDEICVDQQHGFADRATIGSVFRAIELYGVAPTTRVPRNDFADIGKALDLGAVAIVVPMVGSPEEAANAAAACHFPPGGSRSVGPLRGSLLRGHHRLEGLDQAACVVMIETSDGVRNADAIAATPGVDAIYIGPGDLALGLGLSAWPDDWSREQAAVHAEAIDRIRTACVRHGVAPGIHTGDGETANRYREQGFLMITVASDLGLIAKGAGDELAKARGTTDAPARPAAV